MNERDFVTEKRATWDELESLVEKANSRRGLRALNRDELVAFGALYRHVSSDLAYARARASSQDLVVHLNSLAGRAHALLYEAETSGNAAMSVFQFYAIEFPVLLQRHVRLFLAAFGITVLGGVFAYWLVLRHPAQLWLFIPPEFRQSVEAWKSGSVADAPSAEMSGWLMTHNFQVGMIAFAAGAAVGAPTAGALYQNGATMGALCAEMTRVHRHGTFWPGILPHGIAELTAIFICGAAGFLIGLAVLMPGQYTRLEALRRSGLDAVKLVLGTIPLFVFAGTIEGMFSHLPISAASRYAFAAVNGVLWYLYLFMPRGGIDTGASMQPGRNLGER